MILGTCDVWFLLLLDTATHISDLSEFYHSANSNMNCQWCVTLVERRLKCQAVLIIIVK